MNNEEIKPLRGYSDKPEFYVYVHRKPNGDIFYVGKGKGRRAYSKQSRNRHWQFTVDKYQNYSIEIVDSDMVEQDALELEVFLIDFIGISNLTNAVEGGTGASGLVHTEDTKQKMSESHKQRHLDKPEELKEKLKRLSEIHERVRSSPERRKEISVRNSKWWADRSEKELEEIREARSEGAKRMWADEYKRLEIIESLKRASANMDESVKLEKIRKLKIANKKYFETITEEQRKVLVENANKYLRSEVAIQNYKEARCRKLVLNRCFIVESRAELARLLNVAGIQLNVMEDGDYQLKSGFLIENYLEWKHQKAIVVSSLDSVQRIFPVSGNSSPVKNSNNEIFLSVKEAGDSLVNSKGKDQTKQVEITASCKTGRKAYGVVWMKPSEQEVEDEIFKRLDSFIAKFTGESNVR